MNPAPHHFEWPPEKFYWAVLDASGLTGVNSKLSQRLGYLFENVLPGIAIEDIQTAYQSLPDSRGKYVACGLPRSVLAQEVPATVLTLSPREFPAFIAENCELSGRPPAMNLLTGAFTPTPIKRFSRRWLIQAAALLSVCAATIVFGLERRAQSARNQLASIAVQQKAILESVLGPAPTGSQPPALRIVAELRQLEQTRIAAVGPDVERENCSMILAELMKAWPVQVHLQTESISITPMTVTLRGQVPAMADAQVLADMFAALAEWRVAQPQSEARKDSVDVTLRLDRLVKRGSS